MDDVHCDSSSIASDFSIIPEYTSIVNDSEVAGSSHSPIDLNVSKSMIKSITEDMNDSINKRMVNINLNSVSFGTIQRVNNDPNGDLAVIFSAKQDYSIASSDRIGIYKMGFTSPKDFLTFVWVPVSPQSQIDSLGPSIVVPYTAIFKASTIPVDKSVFYQFCYLTQDGQIAGVSVPFQLEQVEKSELVEMENAARNILAVRVSNLLYEQKKSSLQMDDLKTQLEEAGQAVKVKREEQFEEMGDFETMTNCIEALEKKVDKMSTELVDVTSERDELQIMFEKDLKDKISELQELTEKLSSVVIENGLMKDHIKELNEEKEITFARQQVFIQDHNDLKLRFQTGKLDLENAFKEKEAAQKIASDLSNNNMKMAKKISTLMKVEMKIMEAVSSEGFVYQNLRRESADREEVVIEENRSHPNDIENENSISAPSVNSNWAKEVRHLETFDAKIGSILKNLQNILVAEINSTRTVSTRGEDCDASVEIESFCVVKNDSAPENLLVKDDSIVEAIVEKNDTDDVKPILENDDVVEVENVEPILKYEGDDVDVETILEADDRSADSISNVEQSCVAAAIVEREHKIVTEIDEGDHKIVTEIDERSNSQEDTSSGIEIEPQEVKIEIGGAKKLYDNSFLPATPTAPVFLPLTSDSSVPSMLGEYSIISNPHYQASSLNCSTMTQTDYRPVNMIATQTDKGSSAANTSSLTETQLPPPLQPETTPTARNAAVLNQFNEGRTQESDDEDFHSTGDAAEIQTHRTITVDEDSIGHLKCPMCSLQFFPSALSLLNEHMDSHLENICPICSQAFSRSVKQEEFESHVQSHFADESPDLPTTNPNNDSSGPWGSSTIETSGFHLLEID